MVRMVQSDIVEEPVFPRHHQKRSRPNYTCLQVPFVTDIVLIYFCPRRTMVRFSDEERYPDKATSFCF